MKRLRATLALVVGTAGVLAARRLAAQAGSDGHEAAPRADAVRLS